MVMERIGQSLGSFVIEERIGHGGMSDVYRARQTGLERKVALKVLLEGFGADDETLARFRRECELLARRAHPGIMPIVDCGVDQGTWYLAMPLITDPTLEQLLSAQTTRALPLDRALTIVDSLLEALEAIHGAGIIHRDIKPSNLFVSADDQILVADFGLAQGGSHRTLLTRPGMSLGTPRFMSPEQIEGKSVDARSDLYSTGLILYEVLCGCLPFGESHDSMLHAKLSKPTLPSPRLLAPALDSALDALILRAVARDPAQRFPDASTFRSALLRGAKGQRSPRRKQLPASKVRTATPPAQGLTDGPSRGRRGPLVTIGTLAVGIVIGLALRPGTGREARSAKDDASLAPAPASAPTEPAPSLTSPHGSVGTHAAGTGSADPRASRLALDVARAMWSNYPATPLEIQWHELLLHPPSDRREASRQASGIFAQAGTALTEGEIERLFTQHLLNEASLVLLSAGHGGRPASQHRARASTDSWLGHVPEDTISWAQFDAFDHLQIQDQSVRRGAEFIMECRTRAALPGLTTLVDLQCVAAGVCIMHPEFYRSHGAGLLTRLSASAGPEVEMDLFSAEMPVKMRLWARMIDDAITRFSEGAGATPSPGGGR